MNECVHKKSNVPGRCPTCVAWLAPCLVSMISLPLAQAEDREKTIEEVIVTAQKRAQRAIDTPISIGVLAGDDLDRGSSRTVANVLDQVGGVSMVQSNPGTAQVTVRGAVAGAGAATAGYYLDEIPLGSIVTSGLPDPSAYDLQRVEVLRGPQGTLYGVNAMTGVVRVLTSDADLDNWEAKGRARMSETDHGSSNYGGDFALNMPLIPGELAVRAAASYSDLSGFINSRFSGTQEYNDTKEGAYRLKTNYQPTEKLNVRLGLFHSDTENVGPSRALSDLNTPFSDEQDEDRDLDAYNLIAQYDWSAVSLLSSTSYLDSEAQARVEILFTGTSRLNFFSIGETETLAQEFRLSSRLEGPWQWSIGTMYKDTEQLTHQDARPGVALGGFTLPFVYTVKDESESYAVFGELTRGFADGKFEVTGGLRYFEDDVSTVQESDFTGGTTNVVPATAQTFDKVTGRLVLTYKPQPDRIVYASASTGFKSGMNQVPAVVRVSPEFPAVDPDSLINYEIGTKGAALEGTLTYDAAVYYIDWKDIQQSLVTAQGFEARVNAGSASGAGVDASVAVRPVDAVSLYVAAGWNDLTFDDDVFGFTRVPGLPGFQQVTLFPKGARINNSPEWTGSVGVDYGVPTPLWGARAVFATNFSYRSAVAARSFVSGISTATESDTLRTWNASIGLEGDRWGAQLYGDNLLNEWEAVTAPDITSGNTSVRMRPRTIGLQVTFAY